MSRSKQWRKQGKLLINGGQNNLADTSIFIDHFRKTVKSNSRLVSLYDEEYEFCISVITEFEIYSGASGQQIGYWRELLKGIQVLNFDSEAAEQAVKIYNKLNS